MSEPKPFELRQSDRDFLAKLAEGFRALLCVADISPEVILGLLDHCALLSACPMSRRESMCRRATSLAEQSGGSEAGFGSGQSGPEHTQSAGRVIRIALERGSNVLSCSEQLESPREIRLEVCKQAGRLPPCRRRRRACAQRGIRARPRAGRSWLDDYDARGERLASPRGIWIESCEGARRNCAARLFAFPTERASTRNPPRAARHYPSRGNDDGVMLAQRKRRMRLRLPDSGAVCRSSPRILLNYLLRRIPSVAFSYSNCVAGRQRRRTVKEIGDRRQSAMGKSRECGPNSKGKALRHPKIGEFVGGLPELLGNEVRSTFRRDADGQLSGDN